MRLFCRILLNISLLLLISHDSIAQDTRLLVDSLRQSIPQLNDSMDISVNDVPFDEFLKAFNLATGLNICLSAKVDSRQNLEMRKVCNADLLLMLCGRYDLEIRRSGNILELIRARKQSIPRAPAIHWDHEKQLLSLDLKDDSLMSVVRHITRLSGINVLLSPELKGIKLNCMIGPSSIRKALDKVSFSSGLIVEMTADSCYQFRSNFTAQVLGNLEPGITIASGNNKTNFRIRSFPDGSISAYCLSCDLSTAIISIAAEIGKSVLLTYQGERNIEINFSRSSLKSIIASILSANNLAYYEIEGILIIGSVDDADFSSTSIVHFQNRSVTGLSALIPENILGHCSISVDPAQNSILVHGPKPKSDSLIDLLTQLDIRIPMIIIDVIITDKITGITTSTGIEAGISQDPITQQIQVLPSPAITLGGGNINQLIDAFNGIGWMHLGHVGPDFYLTLSALEEQGILDIHSSPRLTTLNGQEAELSIGKTEYYVEERNDVIGSQNPQTIQTRRYQAVTADLAISLTPSIAANGDITLEISVEQSDFTERISPDAPPGKLTRSFTSVIRLEDRETVLLGGLEQESLRESSRGWPMLSRVPVLKWIFSSRSREKEKSTLSLFIKPTIIW